MPAKCFSSVRGRVARFTRVDACGTPIPGPCSQLVTEGFIQVSFSAEVEDGEEITVKKANGQTCISDKGCPQLKWYNLEWEFCEVDPDLLSLTTGAETVTDYDADSVGWRVSEDIACKIGWAAEIWTDVPGQVCDATGAQLYGYFLVPFVVQGIFGDFTIANDALSTTVSARTQKGSGWGVGPYDVVPVDAANTAGPLLTPIGPRDHLHVQLTTIAPPEPMCGCQPLTVPASYTTDSDSDGVVDAVDFRPADPAVQYRVDEDRDQSPADVDADDTDPRVQ